ncbi:hypothetical protein [Albidovulum sp.]|uniref:hypothetical protein n=1 Tax=Albidovulum sp. TaxID=1872424 RepID=UPI0039B9AF76
MTESHHKYSAESLEEFLTYLAVKGLMPKPTVVARKAACSKMLGILDPAERGDIRQIDLDAVAARFENLEGKNYTPDSLKTYKSRVSKAIEDFLRYVDNPSGFKVKGSVAKKNNDIRSDAEGKNGNITGATHFSTSGATLSGAGTVSQVQTINVPVPLRKDCIAQIVGIPIDLTKSEAQKIANVVMAMSAPE